MRLKVFNLWETKSLKYREKVINLLGESKKNLAKLLENKCLLYEKQEVFKLLEKNGYIYEKNNY